MLNNKITEKFFNSFEKMRRVDDLQLIDALIGGCKIIGIEKLKEEGNENDIPCVNVYFKNADGASLALQINPFVTKDNKIDIALFLCKEDLVDVGYGHVRHLGDPD